jgi:hypothetical protein
MLDAAKNDKQCTDADRWATTMAGWLSVASRYGAIYLAAAVRTSRPSIVPVPELFKVKVLRENEVILLIDFWVYIPCEQSPFKAVYN